MVTEMAARGEAFGAEADRGDFEVFRSGSAPPTVEGAMSAAAAAADSLFLDDELRADPAYQSYYYSNAHLNPRLPPPLLSKEDWRSSRHRLRSSGLGGIGDGRRQPPPAQATVGLPGIDLARQRSFSTVFQVLCCEETSNLLSLPYLQLVFFFLLVFKSMSSFRAGTCALHFFVDR
jgi:pumilio RNA-binding family